MQNRAPPAFHVLILDDQPGEREGIKASIEQEVPNCTFTEADCMAAAQKVLNERVAPFDLAIVDLVLADGHRGLDLFGPNRAIHPWVQRTRVIVLTAYPSWESACEAYESGASAYLSKLEPNSTVKLQQKAKELLLANSSRRQSEAQMRADEAFATHYDRWCEQYAGKYLLVRGKEVLAVQDSMLAVAKALDQFSEEDRPDIGLVKVPRRPGIEERDA